MVAVLYSIRNKRPLLSSLMSSSILAGAHFLSSIVVVAAFIFVTIFIQIPQTYLNYAVAAALGILAYLFWKEKGEDLIETQHGGKLSPRNSLLADLFSLKIHLNFQLHPTH
jgi:hypothetical protein